MRVRYVGHATCIVELAGKRLITDPNFATQLKGVVWRHGPRPQPSDIGKIDFIVLSHSHMDHLDRPSLRRFPRSTPIVCSEGFSDILKRDGFQNVHELQWWKTLELRDLRMTSVPSHHFKGRLMFDRHRRYGGFVVEEISGNKKESFYFSGDTGYFDGFIKIGKLVRQLTLALLPIGCFRPERFLRPVHMSPEDALIAFGELKARWMVPIHWGVFRLGLDRVREPITILKDLLHRHPFRKQVRILDILESATLE